MRTQKEPQKVAIQNPVIRKQIFLFTGVNFSWQRPLYGVPENRTMFSKKNLMSCKKFRIFKKSN